MIAPITLFKSVCFLSRPFNPIIERFYSFINFLKLNALVMGDQKAISGKQVALKDNTFPRAIKDDNKLHESLHFTVEKHFRDLGDYVIILNLPDDNDPQRYHISGVDNLRKSIKRLKAKSKKIGSDTRALPDITPQRFPINGVSKQKEQLNSRVLYKRNLEKKSLKDQILHGDLYAYFDYDEKSLRPEEIEIKTSEKNLLDPFFDFDSPNRTDKYVSLPLLNRGKFIGAFHIIYKRQKEELFENIEALIQLMEEAESNTL